VVAHAAQQADGVIMLGHQTGAALAELYSHAGVFVLPSSHEGQPIAVLEAMSYGCPTILSDIPPHREIGASNSEFVAVGDIAALAEQLHATFWAPTERRLDGVERERFMENHDWGQIARDTLEVYVAARADGSGIGRRDVHGHRPQRRPSLSPPSPLNFVAETNE
jgi:glycosyltransferase involved in cell wall biosynthesis